MGLFVMSAHIHGSELVPLGVGSSPKGGTGDAAPRGGSEICFLLNTSLSMGIFLGPFLGQSINRK